VKKLLFKIGFRYLKSRNNIYLPSIGIAMSIVGVALSMMILIIVTSVMNGFRAELLSKILGLNSHITINGRYENYIENYKEILTKIQPIKEIESTTPVVIGYGMLANTNGQVGVMVKGIEFHDLTKRKDIINSIFADWDLFQKNEYGSIIGIDIANTLNVKEKEELNLITPVVIKTSFGVVPRFKTIQMSGFLRTNAQQYDSSVVIMPLKGAQKIYNLENKVTMIEIITTDPNNIFKIKQAIKRLINDEKILISDWQMSNKPLMDALKTEATVMSLILSLFVIIAMFAVFTIISMMITDKEREIAILRVHGISSKEIVKIFMITGFFIIFFGMIAGNLLGIVIAKNIDNIRLLLETILQRKILDGSVYFLTNLPSKIMVKDIIYINIFTITTGFFSFFLPSLKAGKKNIQEILRAF
jgi:lipoprotein-releasing system permease protein